VTAVFHHSYRLCRTWGALAAPAVALLTGGCSVPAPKATAAPAVPAVPPPRFQLTEKAAARGVTFRHTYGTRAPITIVETMGSGCGIVDYDRDGSPDLFLVNAGQDYQKPSQEPGTRLYRNRGDGSFEDVTEKAGIALAQYAMGCCAGDYDNDGWTDLFVSGFGRNTLLRNRGDGTFEDVSQKAGILPRRDAWGTGCSFVDVNRDGYVDLYVANYVVFDPAIPLCRSNRVMSGCTPNRYKTQRNELYLNRRNGTFTEEAVGLGADDPSGAGLGVTVSDFDGDGWQDLFVANDGTPNALLHNRRGRFRNIGGEAGVAFGESGVMRAGMGTDTGDYDGDGRIDLVVTNFQHEPNSLYRNVRSGLFEDLSFASGVGAPAMLRLGFGVSFVDLDCDGRSDLYVGNGHVYDNAAQIDDTATFEQVDQVLHNSGSGRFTEVPPASGAYPAIASVSRGLAVGDLNNDGAPDILINSLGRPVRLLEDRPVGPFHWLGLTLEGTRSNRSAIGARVELRGAGGLQVREVRSGGSYLSQSDFRVLFGLGSAEAAGAVTLRIRWPSGAVETLRPAGLDRYVTVREGGNGRAASAGGGG
jgi:enediyne biosynthesis protein E4